MQTPKKPVLTLTPIDDMVPSPSKAHKEGAANSTPFIKYPTPLLGTWAEANELTWGAGDRANTEPPLQQEHSEELHEHSMSSEHSETTPQAHSPHQSPEHAPTLSEAPAQLEPMLLEQNNPYATAAVYDQSAYEVYGETMMADMSAEQMHQYNQAPVFSYYPGYEEYPQYCTCGCGQVVGYTSYAPQPTSVAYGAAEPTLVPQMEAEESWPSTPSPPSERSTHPPVQGRQRRNVQYSSFVPRFSPPPPPPVRMQRVLEEHGNPAAEQVRYHATMRWYQRISDDAQHFSPEVTELPALSSNKPFDAVLQQLHDWWMTNFGSKTELQPHRAHHHTQGQTTAAQSTHHEPRPQSRQPQQPISIDHAPQARRTPQQSHRGAPNAYYMSSRNFEYGQYENRHF
jgi:hypothetical protein